MPCVMNTGHTKSLLRWILTILEPRTLSHLTLIQQIMETNNGKDAQT